MSALSSVALLPAAVLSPSIAGECLPEGDRRLLELAREILAIQLLYDQAQEREGAAWELYHEQEPERPRELIWRVSDPVGYEIERLEGNLCTTWCRRGDIESLRGSPLMRSEFFGTDEEWRSDASHAVDEDGKPANAHLWRAVPDSKSQPRADELIAALDRWDAEKDKLQQKLGIVEHEARGQELYDQMHSLQKEMIVLPATTMEGVRAKAMVLFRVCWLSDVTDRLTDSMDAKFIHSLVADLGEGVHPAAA